MRTLMLVMVCSLMVGCKAWGPTDAGDDVTGPTGESAKTIVGNLGETVIGPDGRNIGESLVALIGAVWLWKRRKSIATAVKTP